MVQVAKIVRNLAPAHAGDFAAALAGQDQKADDRAIGRGGVAGGPPNLADFVVAQHALALGDALGDRQIRERIGVHRAALHGPGEGGSPIGGRAAGHGGALWACPCRRVLARPAPRKGVQGAHDGRPVQILAASSSASAKASCRARTASAA